MSALPRYFRLQPARQLLARRPPRSRDSGRCSRSWCDRVAAGLLGGCRFDDKSAQLLSAAANGCQKSLDPIRCLLSSLPADAHIVGSRCSARNRGGSQTGNRPVLFRTTPYARQQIPESAPSAQTSPDVRFSAAAPSPAREQNHTEQCRRLSSARDHSP